MKDDPFDDPFFDDSKNSDSVFDQGMINRVAKYGVIGGIISILVSLGLLALSVWVVLTLLQMFGVI